MDSSRLFDVEKKTAPMIENSQPDTVEVQVKTLTDSSSYAEAVYQNTKPNDSYNPYDVDIADSKSGKKKKKKKENSGSLFQLFSFATIFDWLLMAVGLLAAIIHGAILPASMFVFGQMINLYVYQNFTGELWGNVTNSTPNSLEPNCTVITSVLPALIRNATNNPAFANFAYICRTESEFFEVLLYYIYGFIGLGVGSFLLGFIQVATFALAAKRQTHHIRKVMYKAILRQNIAWFDENKAGELNSRLVDDLVKVQEGIGDKLSIFFQLTATFFTAFIVGFALEWRLTLLMLGCTPILAISAFVFTKLLSLFTSKEQKEYAVAGAVATEVLSSIRTVQAFGGEQNEHARYCEQLKAAKALGAKKGAVSGLSIGLIYIVIFAVYAVALW
jgi:ATP-binding cassette subfamily B (MDR/TAP) protein 1